MRHICGFDRRSPRHAAVKPSFPPAPIASLPRVCPQASNLKLRPLQQIAALCASCEGDPSEEEMPCAHSFPSPPAQLPLQVISPRPAILVLRTGSVPHSLRHLCCCWTANAGRETGVPGAYRRPGLVRHFCTFGKEALTSGRPQAVFSRPKFPPADAQSQSPPAKSDGLPANSQPGKCTLYGAKGREKGRKFFAV